MLIGDNAQVIYMQGSGPTLLSSRPRFSFAKDAIIGIGSFAILVSVFTFLLNVDYAMLGLRVQAFLDPKGFSRAEKIPQSWLDRYNLVITTDADLTVDVDNDGLSLYDEYIQLTDPITPDTDGDGAPDGKEVAEGSNPRGLGSMDTDRDGMPDKWERDNRLDAMRNDRNDDSDDDRLSHWQEYVHRLDPHNPDTDGDTFLDGAEIANGYDPSAPGDAKTQVTISISKINVSVPMVWSSSINEEQLQQDLLHGASHYPQTASPGQSGNMFIAAHSSNFAWVQGNFNYIFSRLDEVVPGDTFSLTVVQANGASLTYVYKAVEKRIVMPDDPWIFLHTDKATATFSTCWPLGTRQKRLIVKADLVSAP